MSRKNITNLTDPKLISSGVYRNKTFFFIIEKYNIYRRKKKVLLNASAAEVEIKLFGLVFLLQCKY